MNRLSFYGMGLGGVTLMGVLVATPICRPVFGTLLGSDRDQQEHKRKLFAQINGTEVENHHDDHHGHGHKTGHH
ncbi:hypothetical protein DLAC_11343 [Tieghemostelium lacteum]|uniref:Uncharacterized protein n=1 Tax=Tieghemostelium lacteum TaxID=361077 RepID=A0A151Z3R0_TIELA|nr:hypothetical protein DLAC_11343 [Tieghemostelium lacteum]|eukprot:KYQ88602.1 hypothetical protein DLAC_11343 [Tieghemostelium lacteum]